MSTEATALNDTERVVQALEAARSKLIAIFADFLLRPEEAEDVLQDVPVLTLRRRAEIRTLEGWLVGATRVLCLMRARRIRRRREKEHQIEAAFRKRVQRPEQERLCLWLDLEKGLAFLSPGQRQILELRAAGGGEREVAAEVGYAQASVQKLLRRAVKRLAKFMAPPAAPGCPQGAS